MSCSTRSRPTPISVDDSLQDLPEVLGLGCIEPGGRLIEENRVEGAGEDAGQLDEPPLAGAEMLDGLVEVGSIPVNSTAAAVAASISRPSLAQRDDLAHGVAPRERTFPRQSHVGPYVEGLEELYPLERTAEPEPCPFGSTGSRDVDVMKDDPALGRSHDARAGIESARLPGAVRADEPGDRAGAHGETDVVHRDCPAVANGEVLDQEACRKRWAGCPPRSDGRRLGACHRSSSQRYVHPTCR